jgi:hypothetical protein
MNRAAEPQVAALLSPPNPRMRRFIVDDPLMRLAIGSRSSYTDKSLEISLVVVTVISKTGSTAPQPQPFVMV